MNGNRNIRSNSIHLYQLTNGRGRGSNSPSSSSSSSSDAEISHNSNQIIEVSRFSSDSSDSDNYRISDNSSNVSGNANGMTNGSGNTNGMTNGTNNPSNYGSGYTNGMTNGTNNPSNYGSGNTNGMTNGNGNANGNGFTNGTGNDIGNNNLVQEHENLYGDLNNNIRSLGVELTRGNTEEANRLRIRIREGRRSLQDLVNSAEDHGDPQHTRYLERLVTVDNNLAELREGNEPPTYFPVSSVMEESEYKNWKVWFIELLGEILKIVIEIIEKLD